MAEEDLYSTYNKHQHISEEAKQAFQLTTTYSRLEPAYVYPQKQQQSIPEPRSSFGDSSSGTAVNSYAASTGTGMESTSNRSLRVRELQETSESHHHYRRRSSLPRHEEEEQQHEDSMLLNTPSFHSVRTEGYPRHSSLRSFPSSNPRQRRPSAARTTSYMDHCSSGSVSRNNLDYHPSGQMNTPMPMDDDDDDDERSCYTTRTGRDYPSSRRRSDCPNRRPHPAYYTGNGAGNYDPLGRRHSSSSASYHPQDRYYQEPYDSMHRDSFRGYSYDRSSHYENTMPPPRRASERYQEPYDSLRGYGSGHTWHPPAHHQDDRDRYYMNGRPSGGGSVSSRHSYSSRRSHQPMHDDRDRYMYDRSMQMDTGGYPDEYEPYPPPRHHHQQQQWEDPHYSNNNMSMSIREGSYYQDEEQYHERSGFHDSRRLSEFYDNRRHTSSNLPAPTHSGSSASAAQHQFHEEEASHRSNPVSVSVQSGCDNENHSQGTGNMMEDSLMPLPMSSSTMEVERQRPGAFAERPGAYPMPPSAAVMEPKSYQYQQEERYKSYQYQQEERYRAKMRQHQQLQQRHNTGRTSSSQAQSEPTVGPDQDVFIEIGDGVKTRLRRSKETMTAIANDFYVPATCIGCTCDLFCIADCQYIFCPTCQSISPLTACETNTFIGRDGQEVVERSGVGLGFTYDTLFQMQSDLISNGVVAPKNASLVIQQQREKKQQQKQQQKALQVGPKVAPPRQNSWASIDLSKLIGSGDEDQLVG